TGSPDALDSRPTGRFNITCGNSPSTKTPFTTSHVSDDEVLFSHDIMKTSIAIMSSLTIPWLIEVQEGNRVMFDLFDSQKDHRFLFPL
ncbi:MAG: hypothetical protein ACJAX8_000001, partial [Flavobacteriales bacterium]